MKELKINNINVVPVQAGVGNFTEKNNRAFKIFPESPFFSTFICSKKKSGKSSLINTIIQKATDKHTTFWIFCSTYKIDPTWKAIKSYLENRGNIVNFFDGILDGKTNNLQVILKSIQEDPESDTDNSHPLKKFIELYDEETDSSKPRKSTKIACENMFIFDDIGSSLRNKEVANLLKVHRHSRSSVIISSQYLNDLQPQSILQLDVFIAFAGLSQEKMESIHKQLDLSIDFDLLWKLYKHCTDEKYSFMYLAIRSEEIRCKFNKLIKYD